MCINKIYVIFFKRHFIKTIGFIIMVMSILTLFRPSDDFDSLDEAVMMEIMVDQPGNMQHEEVVANYFMRRQGWTTSKLGSMLFKYEQLEPMEELTQKNKTFIVLVWKYWDWLKKRHVYNFGSSNYRKESTFRQMSEFDPIFLHFCTDLISNDGALTECRVKNCFFSGDNRFMETADAVVIHMQHGNLPKVNSRNPKQRWIFLNDESPKNAFSLSNYKKKNLNDFANVFNWSMCYRTGSDIPVPYGRTVALEKPIYNVTTKSDIFKIIPNWQKKRRDVLVTALISNCIKFRMDFIKELQKYIPIDVYGKCSNNRTNRKRCPGHFRSDCESTSQYLFYLVIENASCREYLSEKVWYHAFSKGAIPIIIGPYRQDCKNLLPPNSFIHIQKSSITNATIKDIAAKIIHASSDEEYIYALHSWRNNFAILNEHGYFGTKSYHLCRLCEALNFNDENEKVYSKRDLERFLDEKYVCMS